MKQGEIKVDPPRGETKANEFFKSSIYGLGKYYKRRYLGEWYDLPQQWRTEFPDGGMSEKEWRRRMFNNLWHAWQRVKREAAKAA